MASPQDHPPSGSQTESHFPQSEVHTASSGIRGPVSQPEVGIYSGTSELVNSDVDLTAENLNNCLSDTLLPSSAISPIAQDPISDEQPTDHFAENQSKSEPIINPNSLDEDVLRPPSPASAHLPPFPSASRTSQLSHRNSSSCPRSIQSTPPLILPLASPPESNVLPQPELFTSESAGEEKISTATCQGDDGHVSQQPLQNEQNSSTSAEGSNGSCLEHAQQIPRTLYPTASPPSLPSHVRFGHNPPPASLELEADRSVSESATTRAINPTVQGPSQTGGEMNRAIRNGHEEGLSQQFPGSSSKKKSKSRNTITPMGGPSNKRYRRVQQPSPSPYAASSGYHPSPRNDPRSNSLAGTHASFFKGAKRFRVGDVNVNVAGARGPVTLNVNSSGVRESSIDGWELLLRSTSPNALCDSAARYDAPKCDEDTRVEVTREIMDWIEDRDGPQQLLCMTGAAGSGKSALQQTIAERCGKKMLAAAFFFSAADSSRNTILAVIPTIAYQIGRHNSDLRDQIKRVVEDDPLILSKSLMTQMSTLIVEPFNRLKDMGIDINKLPYAILIDGLDECMDENHQADLLASIQKCLLAENLPFRIFIASRPEWAIRTALGPGGHLHKLAYHIQLSDKYDASEDMRRYLQRRFEALAFRTCNPDWFTESDIETLVQAASGQFIYVATVFKYVSEPRGSPTHRLQVVLTWTPDTEQRARPFEALDKLYTNILLTAKKAYEAIDTNHGRDFILLFRVYLINAVGFQFPDSSAPFQFTHDVLTALLGLESGASQVVLSDLHSLLTLEEDLHGDLSLRMYHKSFSDFLDDERRAEELFVPISCLYAHVSKCLMEHIICCPLDFDSLTDKWVKLPLSKGLKESVARLPLFLGENTSLISGDIRDFTQKGGWERIDKLLPSFYIANPSGSWFHHRTWIQRLENVHASLRGTCVTVEDCALIGAFCEKWRWNVN